MAKYYYEKYDLNTEWISVSDGQNTVSSSNDLVGYENYSIGINGSVDTSGKKITIPPGESGQVYTMSSWDRIMSRQWLDSQTVRAYYYITKLIGHKGKYLETIIAEDGSYPNDGIRGDYWYVKRGKAGLNLYPRIDGQVKQVTEAKVRIDEQLKDIVGVWIRVDGKLREV